MLADEVRSLIQLAIPNTDALEVVMFLVTHRGVRWSVGDVIAALHSHTLDPAALTALFGRFEAARLGAWEPEAGFTWSPAPEMQKSIDGLVDAYRRQPVTLIRTVYQVAEIARIQALADAF